MKRKHRRRVLSKTIAEIEALKIIPIDKAEKKVISFENILSDTDKLVVAYKCIGGEDSFKIVEVTTVAFVTIIDGQDYTVVFYDNSHKGILHMHRRQSVINSSESIVALSTKVTKDQKKQLNFAINEIRNRWYYFRSSFYKRSNIKSNL